MLETDTELNIFEQLSDDDSDKVHHAICGQCYPVAVKNMRALCGEELHDEVLMPESEIINKCESCMNERQHIGINGKLHVMCRR